MLRRIWDALAPTQGDQAGGLCGHTGRLLARGGTYEHLPLRLAVVDPADVAALAAAAAIFGDPHAADHVRLALEHGADIAYHADDEQACARLRDVAHRPAGRAAGPAARPGYRGPDRAGRGRRARRGTWSCPPSAKTPTSGTPNRANRVWTLGDPIARYLY